MVAFGLNVSHHHFTKIRRYPISFSGIFLMIASSLIFYSFNQPATAVADTSIDYSTLSEWKSVDTGAPVISVAFSPDQSMVAGGLDGKIEIYNDKFELIKELKASENKKPDSNVSPLQVPSTQHRWMMTLAFSPDSKLIAAACYDGTVRIWDVKTGVETICKDPKLAHDEWTARSHSGSVRSIAFSPDGSKIVSGGDDKAVKMWDVKSGKLLWDGEEHVFRVVAVAFSADGSTINSIGAKDTGRGINATSGIGEFKTWDETTGKIKTSTTVSNFNVSGAAISSDGKVAICTGAGALVTVWDVKMGVSGYSFDQGFRLGASISEINSFTSDSTIAMICNPQVINPGSSGQKSYSTFALINVQSGQALIHGYRDGSGNITYIGIPSIVYSIAASKDNRSFAFGCQDGSIQIWSVP